MNRSSSISASSFNGNYGLGHYYYRAYPAIVSFCLLLYGHIMVYKFLRTWMLPSHKTSFSLYGCNHLGISFHSSTNDATSLNSHLLIHFFLCSPLHITALLCQWVLLKTWLRPHRVPGVSDHNITCIILKKGFTFVKRPTVNASLHGLKLVWFRTHILLSIKATCYCNKELYILCMTVLTHEIDHFLKVNEKNWHGVLVLLLMGYILSSIGISIVDCC